MEEKYNIDLKCANCRAPVWNVKIPLGMSIEEFGEKENKICQRCGCQVIKVKEKEEESQD